VVRSTAAVILLLLLLLLFGRRRDALATDSRRRRVEIRARGTRFGDGGDATRTVREVRHTALERRTRGRFACGSAAGDGGGGGAGCRTVLVQRRRSAEVGAQDEDGARCAIGEKRREWSRPSRVLL